MIQTWVRERGTGVYRLDIFREPPRWRHVALPPNTRIAIT
jgi:hypothetical protein